MKKTILVIGATGKQGRALIHALLQPTTTTPEQEYHILALTRNASSSRARHLASTYSPHLTLAEGNLDAPLSIRQIFSGAQEPIWGVFAVLQYPGLGANADGEEAQGKLLADLALEFGVEAFVYSSANGAPGGEEKLEFSKKAKWEIEQHCMRLGGKGLPWVILAPGFFMENFEGMLGSIGTGIMRFGLTEDAELGIIGSEDIGNVVAGTFRHFERYKHKRLIPIAEFSTMKQLDESHQRGTGKRMSSIPSAVAWALFKLNKGAQDLIDDMMLVSNSRRDQQSPELEEGIRLANEAFKMRNYEQWLRRDENLEPDQEQGENWNGLSLGKLLTGRQ